MSRILHFCTYDTVDTCTYIRIIYFEVIVLSSFGGIRAVHLMLLKLGSDTRAGYLALAHQAVLNWTALEQL